MKVQQYSAPSSSEIQMDDAFLNQPSDLTLIFGGSKALASTALVSRLSAKSNFLIGCTTAGEISTSEVIDDGIVVTKIKFESDVRIKLARGEVKVTEQSHAGGRQIGAELKGLIGLKLVFILGTGVNINGSDLIAGLRTEIGDDVVITGGLAGDQGVFAETFTLANHEKSNHHCVAIGLAGDHLKIGHGSEGGWKPFGPARKVTKSKGNLLQEIDSEPALKVYEMYLGDKAKDLPRSGLLYPFAVMKNSTSDDGLIRTILGIDRETGSLILAGDMPTGSFVRLMHAGTDSLVEGAREAAKRTVKSANDASSGGLALLVSCIGRKIVMGDDTEEELDAVKEVLPAQAAYAGFYSYGEIGSFQSTNQTMLHNQTMTITYIEEAV